METTINSEQAERAVKVVDALLDQYPYVVYGVSLTKNEAELLAGEFLTLEGMFFAKSAIVAICAAADGYTEVTLEDEVLCVTVARGNGVDEFCGDPDDVFQQVCEKYSRAYDTQDSFWR